MARINPNRMMLDSDGDTTPTATSTVDPRIALRKLQSGETLTDDEKRSLGLSVTAPTVTDTTVVDNKPQWTKGFNSYYS